VVRWRWRAKIPEPAPKKLITSVRNRKRPCSTALFTHSYNPGMLRRSAWLLTILAAACPLLGQSTVNTCATLSPKLVFEDTTNGMRVIYHIPDIHRISAAWLEVWDRPQRLFRTAIPVKTAGQIIWDPDDPYPTTPEMLSLAIYDAEVPEYCIDNFGGSCSGPSFGSNVSPVVVGNTTNQSSGNAELEGPLIRLVEGGDVTDVIATGRDLPPDMKVILVEKDETTEDYRWIFHDYLNTGLSTYGILRSRFHLPIY